MFGTAELGRAEALPIPRFVLNPLWVFNRNLMYEKAVIGSLGGDR